MDVDSVVNDKSFSVPGFLRKVFMKELRNYSGHDHKLLVIALHAVLLDSGFVGFDKNANVVVNGLCYPADVWPTLSLYYTLPEIGTAHTVVLKFQSIGKCMTICGSLNGGGGSGKKISTHKVVLNEEKLVSFRNCGVKENVYPEFRRTVKDNLSLPLLIDICEKAGLEVPPYFMSLPSDLKLKIVESLSSVEIAKVSVTCSELRSLASSDYLWKMKFEEEFGKNANKGEGCWKMAFVRKWEMRRLCIRARLESGGLRVPFYSITFGDNFGVNAYKRLARLAHLFYYP